ncbi:unnamed protein product [Mytilus edulis]|uniref:Uncharacterized protein n=1 Tax=Mytilus edulis TaxID=6550 RepID=A0A8S3PNF0_MYTED|nr:unnamed protein product [Mytilus edulis]
MYIANSRIGVDKGVGKTTCKNTSVVDYLLLSSKLFTLVKEFEIQQFDPLLSDVHSAIHITLKSQSTSHKNNSVTSDQTPKTRWHDNKRNQFVNTVHNKKEQLSAILNDLHTLHSSDHCTQHEIDKVVDSIGEILVSSANETFIKKTRTTTQRTNQKPWYTKQLCHDGKCTHTENPGSKEDIAEPKFPKFPDIGDAFKFLNFGGIGLPTGECKDGQIDNMFYVKLFNTCYKTICVNGLWKDKTVHGPCYEG